MQTRRTFVRDICALSAATALSTDSPAQTPAPQGQAVRGNPLPRWRGFNFQHIYMVHRGINPPVEDHFRWIGDWGFDFVRMPMSYRAWLKRKPTRTGPPLTVEDVYAIDESTLELIDQSVEYAGKHHIHLCLCFHHAPGFRTGGDNRHGEPFVLWKDKEARDALAFHWKLFAKRYASIPNTKLSFNLLNEAPWYSDNFNAAVYHESVAPAVRAIREISPDRIVIADGAGAGNLAVPELADLDVAQSVHCYIPGALSHYKVDWMEDVKDWPVPDWPNATDFAGYKWSYDTLKTYYQPWKRLVDQGIGVHMGETGGSHRLPHQVYLAWLGDVLRLCKEIGIGYAIWDFIGHSKFGILDSNRDDVAYEDWYGHKLDRKMLELLQRS